MSHPTDLSAGSALRVPALRAALLLSLLPLQGCAAPGSFSEAALWAPASRLDPQQDAELRDRLAALLVEHGVPGCAASLLRDGAVVWSAGFGHADVERQIPMTPQTILNIGSVTKTVTTTAVLQLVEDDRVGLDDDVGGIVGFAVRNPAYPDVPITLRQLLTHRSSILDGVEYGESYACGDREEPLGDWLRAYFAPEAARDHFHSWAPGTLEPPREPRAYSNVAFGLLGHVVEALSGLSYEDYCRRRIFAPLGMDSSGFRIDRIDAERHAVPYSRLDDDAEIGPDFVAENLGRYSMEERPPQPGELFAHCLYSFATPPDGLLRSTALDLSRFLMAWIGSGALTEDGLMPVKLLEPETVRIALTPTHLGRALCWDRQRAVSEVEPMVLHSGGDPGIATIIAFRPEQKSGLVLMFNTGDPGGMFRGALDALVAALP